ncbi:MAG: hypothetical protein EP343_13765 [Deltaproteobacteria bacterium]|nr:MAG: hypothetical protein EP343_13765 [Deltaproteobacteria bacterium]
MTKILNMRRLGLLGWLFGWMLMMGACGTSNDNNNNNQTNNTNTNTKSFRIECYGNSCDVWGQITEDTTFEAEYLYVLRGGVQVGDENRGRGNIKEKVTLTIQAGTKIVGSNAERSYLQINRGGRIMAVGTKEKPIVFTSPLAPGSRNAGDWGGLIINGWAPVNGCTKSDITGMCELTGEGVTGQYGGDQPEDDSGALKYVRVEFAGGKITAQKELNGISFQGVGSKTQVEYIQVHQGRDDGVELFGGTVNIRWVLITGPWDDGLDWTNGWVGKAQFVIVQQYPGHGDNGIEADNNENDMKASPRSKPTLSNITLVGSPNSQNSDLGMLLRFGTAARLWNVIVTGFNDACLALDNDPTLELAFLDPGFTKVSGELALKHSLIHCKTSYKDPCKTLDEQGACKEQHTEVVKRWFEGQDKNVSADPQLTAPTDPKNPNFKPKDSSPALQDALDPSTQDKWFRSTAFKGAIGSTDWLQGWVTYDEN